MRLNKGRLCLAMAVMVLFLSLSGPAYAVTPDYRSALDALSSKYTQLEKEQKAIQKEIDKAKNAKEKQLAEKKQLDNQIYSVREQIALLAEKITILESSITERQEEMKRQSATIGNSLQTLKKRLRVMYSTGSASLLGLVLGAEDFSQFLTRAQVASRVAQHDRQLVEDMRHELSVINLVKDEIDDARLELEDAKTQMAEKQADLGDKLKKTNSQIQDLEALEKEYKANKNAIDKQMKEVQAEVDEIYRQIQSVGEYEGGVMLWPVLGYTSITSYYGWRFGGSDFHTGVDIARTNAAGQGIYGKPIRAAASGKVVFAQTKYIAYRGYGIYLIIDHGSNISTLYGHCSSLAVKVGQKVNRGDTIGYVGSTGWSTGPHLHFEVRVNGKHVNPLTYLK
ncbi:MAG: peptidoglycan DD-metalloendopeptidase family protein [Pygmaiobacter sp.]|nr:peptidoglycan DD-metalloendopeptidase family protein [Pygmaiobacter sp.]